MADYEIREAAESLLGSFSQQNTRYNQSIAHQASINLISEEVISGHRYSGRMSSIRRFFCLFVTFDMLFTALIWLICVMMKGETLVQIFNREVIHYSIKVSLFDIVAVAILRFLLLILFYAAFYINNWSVIAISTAGTCAFLIAKVFVYDWQSTTEPVYQVFLVLTSFTLAWGEAWFLDFRVLPQELKAKQLLEVLGREYQGRSERTPLLAGRAPSQYGESTVHWFSPVDTPEASPRPSRQVVFTQEQIEEYTRQAEECLRSSWKVLNMGGWKLEKRGERKGDKVESIATQEFGKVYRFTGTVDCPAQFLFSEISDNMTKLPEWNPTVLKSEFIKKISTGVDLSYQVTAGGGRGMIKPRDFVTLRRAAKVRADGTPIEGADDLEPFAYISAGVSVEVPGYPPNQVYVRGENKVGCWCIRPSADGARCTFQWLMSCDLKGRIPQFVIDAALATVMLDYVVHVRKFAADSKAKGLY